MSVYRRNEARSAGVLPSSLRPGTGTTSSSCDGNDSFDAARAAGADIAEAATKGAAGTCYKILK